MSIESLQAFLRSAGSLGVWVYIFLERILIPTGLHHFVYGPFSFGSAVVESGIQVYWAQNLQEFRQSTEALKHCSRKVGLRCTATQKFLVRWALR